MRLILLQILVLLAGIVIGSFARPVSAQSEAALYKVGQRVTLAWVGDRFAECEVAEIRGAYMRCEGRDLGDGPLICSGFGVRR
jgi:hypothetical protein